MFLSTGIDVEVSVLVGRPSHPTHEVVDVGEIVEKIGQFFELGLVLGVDEVFRFAVLVVVGEGRVLNGEHH